ncbi:MAG: class I SAM-dependent methyltransferase [Candidatus Limnocylindrales bacterium]
MARVTPSALKAYIREDYDAAAAGWEPHMGPYFRIPAEQLVADLEPERDERCLDLACGTGLVARAFAARVGASRVAACDFAPLQVREARAACEAAGMPAIDLRVMDAEQLGYPEGAFERVGCGFGFSHFPHPMRALCGILRVLAPGGLAGFTVWGAFSPSVLRRFEERLLQLVPAVAEGGAGHEEAFGRLSSRNGRPDRIARLMQRAGFEGVELRAHHFDADYVGAAWFVDAMLSRAERDLRRAALDGAERTALREALLAELAPFPRQAFVVRRGFHSVLGRKPGGR